MFEAGKHWTSSLIFEGEAGVNPSGEAWELHRRDDTQHSDAQYNDIQHDDTGHNNKQNVTLSIIADHCYAECRYAGCRGAVIHTLVDYKPYLQRLDKGVNFFSGPNMLAYRDEGDWKVL